MGLSEYERRTWAEIEARLVRERRRSSPLGRTARLAATAVAGLLVAGAAVLAAVLAGDVMLAGLALVSAAGSYLLWPLGAAVLAAVVLLRGTRSQGS